MAAPVVHFEILSKDAKKAQAFYSELFGWKIEVNNPMNYGLVQAAEGGIGGGVGPAEQGPPHLTFYIQVPDLQACLDKVESMGGKTIVPPTEIPDYVTFAMFSDLDGHVVGIIKG